MFQEKEHFRLGSIDHAKLGIRIGLQRWEESSGQKNKTRGGGLISGGIPENRVAVQATSSGSRKKKRGNQHGGMHRGGTLRSQLKKG